MAGRRGAGQLWTPTLARLDDDGTRQWISDSKLGADAASFDITNIPADFAHLLIVLSLRGDIAATNTEAKLRLNNDTGANYYQESVWAATTSIAAGENLATASPPICFTPGNTAPANIFASAVLWLPDYANAARAKACVCIGTSLHATSSGNNLVRVAGVTWNSTAAVNRVTILPVGGTNWKAGSRVAIYGIGAP